jgi:ribosomal protein S27AE
VNPHTEVRKALRDGELVRQPCVRCGNPQALAHHEDYSEPLVVVWLCYSCHQIRHHEITPLRPRKRPVSVVMIPQLLRQLDAMADQRGLTRSSALNLALADYFAANPSPHKRTV